MRPLCEVADGQLVLVTGKGGVGKSTVAAAVAWQLAGAGRRVLLLEVDPRESLHQLLGVAPSGGVAVPVTAAPAPEGAALPDSTRCNQISRQ